MFNIYRISANKKYMYVYNLYKIYEFKNNISWYIGV